MSLFKQLQLSFAALALVAALGITIERGHAAHMFARPTASDRFVTPDTPQRGSTTIFNSINAKRKIAAGVNPEG